MIIRVGDGHNMAWEGCRWYRYQKRKSKYYPNGIDSREKAIQYALETNKDIFVSYGRSYRKITIDQLRNL